MNKIINFIYFLIFFLIVVLVTEKKEIDPLQANSKSPTGLSHDFIIKSHAIPTYCDQCSQVLTVQGIQCKSKKFVFRCFGFLKKLINLINFTLNTKLFRLQA